MEEQEQLVGGDGFHCVGMALVVGEVNEKGLAVKVHEDGANLTGLQQDRLLSVFMDGGDGEGEGNDVIGFDGHDAVP